jgi:cytochrome c6
MNARRPVLRAALAILAVCCSPGHAADTGKGGQLYAKHCASCHGSSGVPVMPGIPNFTQPQAMMRSDAALATVIRNGRMTMPGYRGLLKDSEVYDVIAYMRTLLR